MTEVWRDVIGYEGHYQISNLGRIKSLGRRCADSRGRLVWHDGKILKQTPNSQGYYRISLRLNGKSEYAFIHRLVALHFVENPNPVAFTIVNHIDFNPHNNCYTNLEWTTLRGNSQHSLKAGRLNRTEEWKGNLRRYNESHGRSVIGRNLATGQTIVFKCLNDCKKAGFQPSCVCYCCKGKRGISQHKGYEWRYADE